MGSTTRVFKRLDIREDEVVDMNCEQIINRVIEQGMKEATTAQEECLKDIKRFLNKRHNLWSHDKVVYNVVQDDLDISFYNTLKTRIEDALGSFQQSFLKNIELWNEIVQDQIRHMNPELSREHAWSMKVGSSKTQAMITEDSNSLMDNTFARFVLKGKVYDSITQNTESSSDEDTDYQSETYDSSLESELEGLNFEERLSEDQRSSGSESDGTLNSQSKDGGDPENLRNQEGISESRAFEEGTEEDHSDDQVSSKSKDDYTDGGNTGQKTTSQQ